MAERTKFNINEIEQAYGLLWTILTPDTRIHKARKLLAQNIGREGMRRGIQYALKTQPSRDAGITDI